MFGMTTLIPPPPPGPAGRADRAPLARRIAWMVAIGADVLQWVAIPFFAPGAASPVNDALDVAVGIVLVRLLGWHWSFLPTFIAELLPGVDLVPSWTIAVWLTRRGAARVSTPPVPVAKPPGQPE